MLLGWFALVAGCSGLGSASAPEPEPPTCAPLADLGAPTWTAGGTMRSFSAPRAVELNGDGVLDVVVGTGREFPNPAGRVVALDGKSGRELWAHDTRGEIFATAAVGDLDGDGGLDIVIGGREATLVRIDGRTGKVVWRFGPTKQDGWFQFYSSQLVDDQDGDGVRDILTANGGEPMILSHIDFGRPVGRLVLLSGASGAPISTADVPDGYETFFAPVLLGDDVLVGTGGERRPGALWRVPLADVRTGDLAGAVKLLGSEDKGVMVPPTLVDMNGDGALDIVAQTFDGAVRVLNGADNAVLWTREHEQRETYTAPLVAQITDDAVPDVFVTVHEGPWEAGWTRATHRLLDGRDGQPIWESALGVIGAAGYVAADFDCDGRTEILMGLNEGEAHRELHEGAFRFHLFDPERDTTPVSAPYPRLAMPSPWLADVDGDGKLELFVITSTPVGSKVLEWHFERFDMDVVSDVAWAGYLGANGDMRAP